MLALGYHLPAMTPKQVRALRKRLGLTQSRFADLIGVHKITVAKWEAGAKGMSATTGTLLRVLARQGTQVVTARRPGGTRRRKGR